MSGPVFFNLVASDGQVLVSTEPGVFSLQPKASTPPFGQITNFYVAPSLTKSLMCSSFLDMTSCEPYYFSGQGSVLATNLTQLVPEIMLIKSECGYKISVGKQYLQPPSTGRSMLSSTPYTWKMDITGGPAFYLQTTDGLFISSSDGSGFLTVAAMSQAVVFELLQGNLVRSGTASMANSSPQIFCISVGRVGEISGELQKVSDLNTGTGAITGSNNFTITPGNTLGFNKSTNMFTTTEPALTVIPTALTDTTKYAVYSLPVLANIKFANPGSYTLVPIPSNCKSSDGKKKLYIGLGVTVGVIVLITGIALSVWWSRKRAV